MHPTFRLYIYIYIYIYMWPLNQVQGKPHTPYRPAKGLSRVQTKHSAQRFVQTPPEPLTDLFVSHGLHMRRPRVVISQYGLQRAHNLYCEPIWILHTENWFRAIKLTMNSDLRTGLIQIIGATSHTVHTVEHPVESIR